MAVAVPTLEVVDRTKIDTVSKITFANSPSFTAKNIAKTNTIQSLKAYLWIWNGAQNLLTTPNATYVKRKISVSDDYINIEIADVVKAFLINPPNAPNTSQPEFAL
jgi:hypothetical protein